MRYSEARTAGMLLYQGRSCPLGHSGERYVSTRNCVTCSKMRGIDGREYSRAYAAMRRISHPDLVQASDKKWRKAHPDKVKQYNRDYRFRNAEKIAAQEKDEYAVNEETIRLLYYT